MNRVSRGVAFVLAAFVLAANARGQVCEDYSIGVVPLDDLRTGRYQGFAGGLYPDGRNFMPDGHAKAGRRIAEALVPLDANGDPASDGVVGVASIGFSLTFQAFEGFKRLAEVDLSLDPSLALVNCAQGGQFADEIADPASSYWTTWIPLRLADAGVDARQVQVVWLQSGLHRQDETFPDHVGTLKDYFVAIVQNIKTTFPNAKLCYLSSLYFMGYAWIAPSVEPYYFEQGFAQKQLIEDQLNGDSELNWDAEEGPVVAPWLAWGPYLWTDGDVPRSDGLTWNCVDFALDGAHPSPEGEDKLGELLLQFWKSDRTGTPWFLASGDGKAGHPADVELIGSGTQGSQGEPRISVSQRPIVPTPESLDLQGSLAIADGSGVFLLGFDLLPGGGVPFARGKLYVETVFVLPVAFDAEGRGAFALGEIPDEAQFRDLVAYAQLVTFDPGGPDGRFALTTAIEIVLGD